MSSSEESSMNDRTARLEEVAQLFRDHAGAAGSVLAWEMQLLQAK